MLRSKAEAHLILTIFDVLSIGASYWVFCSVADVFVAIEASKPEVSFESSLLYLLLLLIMPCFHFLALCRSSKLGRVAWFPRFQHIAITGLAVLIILSKFLTQSVVEKKLSAESYVECFVEVERRYVKSIYKKDAC
ncbi:hypothetical protein [Agaribacterium sp. ZY112]|uniref:hypothetical protein n=1 Tax=Agaribacterium sp. ZY112 TaxID=3233574 RepID=UPI003526C26B